MKLRRALVARDGLVLRGPQVLCAQICCVGCGHGAVREGQPDAAVRDRDVDGDEVEHFGWCIWCFVILGSLPVPVRVRVRVDVAVSGESVSCLCSVMSAGPAFVPVVSLGLNLTLNSSRRFSSLEFNY